MAQIHYFFFGSTLNGSNLNISVMLLALAGVTSGLAIMLEAITLAIMPARANIARISV